MTTDYNNELVIEEFFTHIAHKYFVCVGAKAAVAHHHLKCMVAGHMACPKDDEGILAFIYNFINEYKTSGELFNSAAVIFTEPVMHSEKMFETFLWQRLQSLSNLDAKNYSYDPRVDADPDSPNFSYSLGQEAFFIIGLHPASSRQARQFKYPVLVFNPHHQFEKLKETHKYEHMQEAIRHRDIALSGTINPMLNDFGNGSEAKQYSGIHHDKEWKCPLIINHTQPKDEIRKPEL